MCCMVSRAAGGRAGSVELGRGCWSGWIVLVWRSGAHREGKACAWRSSWRSIASAGGRQSSRGCARDTWVPCLKQCPPVCQPVCPPACPPAACDVMEDVAIAYGYNKLVKTVPKTVTVGKELPLNQVGWLRTRAVQPRCPAKQGASSRSGGACTAQDDATRAPPRPACCCQTAHNMQTRTVPFAASPPASPSPPATIHHLNPHSISPPPAAAVRAAARRVRHGGLHRDPHLGALLACREL